MCSWLSIFQAASEGLGKDHRLRKSLLHLGPQSLFFQLSSSPCRRRRCLFSDVAGRPRLLSSPAAPSWKTEFQCKKARSAPTPCPWHTHRRPPCAIMGERISGSKSVSLPGSPSLFPLSPISMWHVLEPGAPTPGHRQLVPVACPSGPVLERRPVGNRSAIRRSTRRAVSPTTADRDKLALWLVISWTSCCLFAELS